MIGQSHYTGISSKTRGFPSGFVLSSVWSVRGQFCLNEADLGQSQNPTRSGLLAVKLSRSGIFVSSVDPGPAHSRAKVEMFFIQTFIHKFRRG